MAEDAGDKTEDPTPHRMREAREKGQIAKSKEVTTAFVLLLAYFSLRYIGNFIWLQIADGARIIFEQIPAARDNFSLSFAGYLLLIGMRTMAFAVLPIFGVVFIASFIAEAAQTGMVTSTDPLTPRLERINPLEGLKRMFSLQGLFELVKSIIKIVIVFYIAWYTIQQDLGLIIKMSLSHPWDTVVVGANISFTIAMRVGIFYIIIAILDYLYRRWEYMNKLKMSRQEVKEEYKRLEGDPAVKQRMRDLQRQIAYQRMMAAVPQADVVVTNPTHVAVALQYKAAEMKSPKVLAKGERKIAEEIKRIAESHQVPIVENEPLARSIYRTCGVNREIQPELYQAVAEVLAFVYKLKRERKARTKRQTRGIPLKPM